MPRSIIGSPSEPTTTTKTVTRTVTTGFQTEIITTAMITTIIRKKWWTDSPDRGRSSIDMSEERDPFQGDIQHAAHVSGDCVRLFETMSSTAAVSFLAAIASQPLRDNGNNGNSARWSVEAEEDGAILGFFNETMKKDKTDWSGFRSIYKMKSHVAFQKLLESYAGGHYDTLRLLFNGSRLSDLAEHTPRMEEMAPGKAYEIEIKNEQVGGMPACVFRRMLKGGPTFDRNNDI
ncbi:hypothetical protein L486_05892 [Kwoniella mangroviensis CBS 10435]|uniref:Uncharacterized protein n=1 Tax=Kwoniella mangroviensis CBS 10435 TaxID=1331196 RepID=A0A1B9IN82_9TREE|nr:hypothetical protein L486_05892 [Kwoniella mangroviensis CBS 10435]